MDNLLVKTLIERTPRIIREAGRSPLGLASLVVMMLSIVALFYFSSGSETTKVVSFIALLLGLTLFVSKVVRINSDLESGDGSENRDAHQAAAVCYRNRGSSIEFLLILNDSGERRIFPKGNKKEDEALWAAAEREAREEAGVEGNIRKEQLTLFWTIKGNKRPQEMAIAAFLLEVTRRTSEHESNRDPKWFGPKEAQDVLGKNRDSEIVSELQRVLRKAISELDA